MQKSLSVRSRYWPATLLNSASLKCDSMTLGFSEEKALKKLQYLLQLVLGSLYYILSTYSRLMLRLSLSSFIGEASCRISSGPEAHIFGDSVCFETFRGFKRSLLLTENED